MRSDDDRAEESAWMNGGLPFRDSISDNAGRSGDLGGLPIVDLP
jgi:hypothetical protein